MDKIEAIGTPLKNWDVNINYGIKTGYNEAFIIYDATKQDLSVETTAPLANIDQQEAEINRLAYGLYGLSAAEIATVENQAGN